LIIIIRRKIRAIPFKKSETPVFVSKSQPTKSSEGKEMGGSDLFSLVASIAYFVGTGIIFSCGDASHVSYKTLQLMFVQLLLQIPPIFYLGFEDSIVSICIYGWNVFVISSVTYAFSNDGSRLKATYNRHLDDFPFHWLLVLPALIIPIVITFSIRNGTDFFGICSPMMYEEIGGLCSYITLWVFNFSMTPLMFLPQLRVCYNVQKGGGELNKNVIMFLYCMILHSTAILLITVFWMFLWPITTFASILTIFLLGTPLLGKTWLCNCICGRGNNQKDATGDVEMQKGGQGSSPSVAIEDYDLSTINKTASTTSANRATVTTDTTKGKTDPSAANAGDWQTPGWLA